MSGYKWTPRPLSLDSLRAWQPGVVAKRPPCLEVSVASRRAWASEDPDARALAREACKACPIQASCVRRALESDVEDEVHGGFNFANPSERKLAEQWLKAQGKAS